MNSIRSVICLVLGIALLVPMATALLIMSIFVRGSILWWGMAQPFLYLNIQIIRFVGGVKYRVHGRENLPAAADNQPIILCPKHQSTWETFGLPTIMPHPLAYVFKKELLQIPFFGWCLARLDMVHIDRSNRTAAWHRVAQQGVELMARGCWIIMFPEGTRTARGERGQYKTGAARLAVQTGASIIPVAVTSGRCWPRRSFALVPGVIDVSIGPPMPAAGRDPAQLMRAVENWIEAEMRRLDPEAYEPREGVPGLP